MQVLYGRQIEAQVICKNGGVQQDIFDTTTASDHLRARRDGDHEVAELVKPLHLRSVSTFLSG